MDALLAMQLESLMLFSLVIAALILRVILVQLALCLYRKALYEKQLNRLSQLSLPAAYSVNAKPEHHNFPTRPIVISPAQAPVQQFKPQILSR